MLRDAFQNLVNCHSGICFAWHGVLGCGALLLGIWFAFEWWCRPYRDEARVYAGVVRDRARVRRALEAEQTGTGSTADRGPAAPCPEGRGVECLLGLAAERARRQRRIAAGANEPAEPWGWKAVELVRLRPGASRASTRESAAGPDAGRQRADLLHRLVKASHAIYLNCRSIQLGKDRRKSHGGEIDL